MNARFETLSRGNLYRRAYMGLNYRLRTFAGGRLAANCRPTDIAFMMTNLCNAKCVHCDIWKNKGRDDTPTPEQYKTVLSELRSWLGPVHVFFSGGEALLRPYTSDLAAHASAVGLYAEVLTHGYWDDQIRMEKLALASPSRVTVSLDGIGETHTIIRGRENFFEKTTRSLDTLKRIRAEKNLRFAIRLKTVIMEQNIHDVHNVAEYAAANGMEVFYQAVEQNYNTEEDPRWFEHSDNWPKDPSRAVAAVERLIALKRNGLPIRNSYQQLQTMIPYFLNPDAIRVSVQQHTAHLKYPVCAALTNIQVMPNGDVLTCYGTPPIGNIRTASIREIWRNRPELWRGGCCLERRLSPAEAETRGLVLIGATGGHTLDRRS
jgi:MoaA/NifB/PqqE/SkfB family radical SAM enzyme